MEPLSAEKLFSVDSSRQHLNLRTPSIRRGQLHQNTPFEENPLRLVIE